MGGEAAAGLRDGRPPPHRVVQPRRQPRGPARGGGARGPPARHAEPAAAAPRHRHRRPRGRTRAAPRGQPRRPAGTPQARRLSAPAPPVPQHRGGNGALSARRRREERPLPPRAPPGLPRAPGSGGPGLIGPAAPVLPARCWPESWAGAGQRAGLPRPGVTRQN